MNGKFDWSWLDGQLKPVSRFFKFGKNFSPGWGTHVANRVKKHLKGVNPLLGINQKQGGPTDLGGFDAGAAARFFGAHLKAHKRKNAPASTPSKKKQRTGLFSSKPVEKKPVNKSQYKSPTKSITNSTMSDHFAPLGAPSAYSAKRAKTKRVFPTKKKPSKGQKILKTLTPPRYITFTTNAVAESGAPLRYAEDAYGYTTAASNTALWSGVMGQVAGAKAVPGQNAFFAQYLFPGAVIEQFSASLRVNSDAPSAIGVTGATYNQNMFLGKYSVTHELHNPTSVACFVNRYEVVPRLNTRTPGDLFTFMAHGNGDDYLDAINSNNYSRQQRSRVTPGVNPNEFPSWKARFRIVNKKSFTMAAGATLTLPYKGSMNKKIDMSKYRAAFLDTATNATDATAITVNGESVTTGLASDRGTFIHKGLCKIILYQIWGVPAVQSVADDTISGSALSNRVTTTPAQLIVRTVAKYSAHGAVDTARRYLNLAQVNDNTETATSAIVGQLNTHTVTVVNQI